MSTHMSQTELEGTETVLLVEDDDAVRNMLSRGLEALGYKVLQAQNGEEALTIIDARRSDPLDLVVSDIVMPEMNGVQLFARLRDWYPTIRFIFISGYSRVPGTPAGFGDDTTSFLAKPFTVARLAQEARQLLDEAFRNDPRIRSTE